jgi:mRNA-degrading endonuclease RelE of RelBE toxin-antitoxin system
VATFVVRLSVGAVREIEALRMFERRRVVDAIEQSLLDEPTKATKHRKLLHGTRPQLDQVEPVWQLRVGAVRVFYDVDADERIVWIRAVHMKGRRTTQEIL